LPYDISNLWSESIKQFKPYAFATVALNSHKNHFLNPHDARSKIDDLLRNVFLRADQEYHGTRNAVRNVPKDQRFEGLIFYEKLDSYPHAHILLFLPDSIKGDSTNTKHDEQTRTRFLCHAVHSISLARCETAKMLLDEKSDDLPRLPAGSLSAAMDKKSDWDIRPVHDIIGLSSYPVKRFSADSRGLNREAYEPGFLSAFHSPNQLR